MRTNITLKEIAYILGVSVSTVSKALKDSEEISKATREKVKKTAQRYNYRPNSVALNLKCNRSCTIGVIVPELSDLFFSDALDGIMEQSARKNYKVMIYPSKGSPLREMALIKMLTDGSIDGLILYMSSETINTKAYDYVVDLMNRGFPVVLLENRTRDIRCDRVFVDQADCCYQAGKNLSEKNCQNILLIAHRNESLPEWKRGFENAVGKSKMRKGFHRVLEIGEKMNVQEEIEDFLSSQMHIDGVITTKPEFALITRKILKTQVSVVSFVKKSAVAQSLYPNVSYLVYDPFKMGEQATRVLLKKIEGDSKKRVTKTINSFCIDGDSAHFESHHFSENMKYAVSF
ncbi:LacI family DNA-binding transcriptional regulator [Leptobacterium flavescens]|uniref:LacI family DNA-binding transcriptional regulator n=1 Tax=Leptobacterium flavescens TaxID=472055 RepID=A0A6P0ULP7_9FLAO|nr:LacI family DNA-binding transcriptional regulator [Leptobacterium flavescens]NER12838.1 LacI family DNA-binding transcriptional regulator [Leptobacterium flavescens]